MTDIREQYRQFRRWQQTPYQVAPLSSETHDCPTCGTHYQGNFCPRCGQSAKIGRYSFRKALLLFIDVWGLGNRGMFRSIRDLILRPGYMIRDYLGGMQMAYFPPFKMLFLLTTLSILVAHGLNVRGTSQIERQRQEIISIQSSDDPWDQNANQWVDRVYSVQEKYPNALTLALLVLLSTFYYIFFRKSRAIDHLSFPEFFIAMVYTANMLSIYETLLTFLCLPTTLVSLSPLLTVIPLKQMSGFSWKRTILSMLGAVLLMLALMLILVMAAVLVMLFFFPDLLPATPQA